MIGARGDMESSSSYQDITDLGDVALDVVVSRARRLELLDAIDRAHSLLLKDRDSFTWLSGKFQEALDDVTAGRKPKAANDVWDKVEEVLLELQARCKGFYQRLLNARESAERDSELTDEEREGLVQDFSQTIAAVAELHNVVNDLRWAIGESNCNECAESIGPFDNAEALITSIKA
ncbi:MAG TPA: hypothetical protein VF211_02740 [Burkholderiales bacterium]